MALKNHTTTIDSYKTIAEIEYLLIKNGANSIVKEIDDTDCITGLSFLFHLDNMQLPVKLPVQIDKVLEVLKKIEESQFLLAQNE